MTIRKLRKTKPSKGFAYVTRIRCNGWMVYSWIIGHWIGYAHAVARVVAVLGLHYALPDHRYVAIPAAVVVLYLAVIVVQERRWRAMRGATPVAA